MSLAHRYDIHGIVTVASAAQLPELERFRTEASIDVPTIRVRIGRLDRSEAGDAPASRPTRIRYAEAVGSLGFAIDVTLGDVIDVIASPLLAHSPHVLYTNVVEPILRWTFVDMGYALMHGACVARGDDAFLITARTDTGKTTTMLKLLESQPSFSFISDDLTLLSPDGRVLTYPKPLTISRHTLVAVNAATLSRWERAALFVQSRVHSKSGRWFGLLLTKSRLPMATTNAVVQLVIPPPKYHVDRLVPHVRLAREARLAGLIVIERGDEGHVLLDHEEAVEILLRNCEDSYGFPPYAAIKDALHGLGARDRRPVERAIAASALKDVPAVVMRSEHRDWWRHLPAFVNGVGDAVSAAGRTRPTFSPWSAVAPPSVPEPARGAAD